MKVKRYFAPNMRSALEMIKTEQGPDVLILSNRKVDGGVELVTADELTDQEEAQLLERSQQREPSLKEIETADPAPVQAAPSAADRLMASATGQTNSVLWTDSSMLASMQGDLRSLKGLLETQLSGLAWSDFGNRHPLRARLLRALVGIGIDTTLAREVVSLVPDQLDYDAGWHRALAALVLRLPVSQDPILRQGGRYALLGATGVGKSTAVSKLAARYALEHGPESVVIISLDDHRLGAHQQMKALGRLIGCPVYTLGDASALPDILEEMDSRQLVLIDTPGAPPGDPRFRELVERLDDFHANIQFYNVLSATTDYQAAAKMFRAVHDLPIDGCILTKLDEAATLGPALSALIGAGIPLAYTSAGQRVPDDLDVVEPQKLIEQSVELAQTLPLTNDPVIFEQAFSA